MKRKPRRGNLWVTGVPVGAYNHLAGKPFLVMEHCESGDLTRIDLSPYPLREKLSMFRQVCLGVAAAHDKKLIHRDVKPQNVLVRADGSLAVGDFGLCLDLEDREERQTPDISERRSRPS